MGQRLLNLYNSHKNIDNNRPNNKKQGKWKIWQIRSMHDNIHSNSAILGKDFPQFNASEKPDFNILTSNFEIGPISIELEI